MQMFNRWHNKNDKPAKPQCKTNSPGAINKNVNSIGSVIPVKNEVKPAENNKPATTQCH